MVNHLVKSVKPALSLLKLYSTTASVHSTDTGHSPRHLYQDHLSAGEHVRDVIGKSWNWCAAMARVTTRWGTSTRPSSSLSYCTPDRHGGVIPARPTSNVSKQLYDVLSGSASIQLTILRRPYSLLTLATIFLRKYWTILVMFCTNCFQTTPNILTISDLGATLRH